MIQEANANTSLTISGITRSISDWLVWRRDVAPNIRQHLTDMSNAIQRSRTEATKRGFNVVAGTQSGTGSPNDLLVNIDEQQLAKEIESLEELLGKLDGQLSLKNATTEVMLDS